MGLLNPENKTRLIRICDIIRSKQYVNYTFDGKERMDDFMWWVLDGDSELMLDSQRMVDRVKQYPFWRKPYQPVVSYEMCDDSLDIVVGAMMHDAYFLICRIGIRPNDAGREWWDYVMDCGECYNPPSHFFLNERG